MVEVEKVEIKDYQKLEVWSESHSVSKLGFHIVWCTKYRHPALTGNAGIEVKKVIAETCREYGWACRSIEVMPDHVHLFIQIHPTERLTDVVRTLKSISAVAIFCKFPDLKANKFWGSGLWSKSTYYGSVGQVSQGVILKYLDNQKKDLKTVTMN